MTNLNEILQYTHRPRRLHLIPTRRDNPQHDRVHAGGQRIEDTPTTKVGEHRAFALPSMQ
ncbi:hypothetical protein B0H19DRAFT_1161257 [Mycena capillaripes]|nr:hypothetical protein B0H19DRAFT_1161257 [Mycena capillaripes]